MGVLAKYERTEGRVNWVLMWCKGTGIEFLEWWERKVGELGACLIPQGQQQSLVNSHFSPSTIVVVVATIYTCIIVNVSGFSSFFPCSHFIQAPETDMKMPAVLLTFLALFQILCLAIKPSGNGCCKLLLQLGCHHNFVLNNILFYAPSYSTSHHFILEICMLDSEIFESCSTVLKKNKGFFKRIEVEKISLSSSIVVCMG